MHILRRQNVGAFLPCLLSFVIACGGGGEGSTTGPTAPPPTLTSLSRDTAMAGGAIVYFEVQGSGYDGHSRVRWNSIVLQTVYVDAGHLTAHADTPQLAVPGSYSITVQDEATGDTSAALVFHVLPAPPTPVYDSISPSHPELWQFPESITVYGAGFDPRAKFEYDSSGLWIPAPARWIDSTRLRAVWRSMLCCTGSLDYATRVENPTAAPTPNLSATRIVTVVQYQLRLDSVTPDTVPLAGDTVDLTLHGSRFSHLGSTLGLWFAGVSYLGSVVDDSTAVVGIPTLAFTDGMRYSPYLSGGIRAPDSIFALPRVPVLVSATRFLPAGTSVATDLGIEVIGDHFAPYSVALIDGVAHPTYFGNSGRLGTSISIAEAATPGSHTLQVVTAPPGGGVSSGSVTIQVILPRPVPTLDSIAPNSIAVSGTPVAVTLYGAGFDSTSMIVWGRDSVSLGVNYFPATFISATQLQASITDDGLGPPETLFVWVETPTPGGGSSARVALQVH